MHKQHKNKDGFTLVELAIVMIIFGITLSIISTALATYLKHKQRTHTLKALESSIGVTELFLIQEGRYPCPADPELAPGHPDYGYEARPCAQNVDSFLDPDQHEVAASTTLTPIRALDRDADGENGKDWLLFGAVPFKTIEAVGITDEFFSGAATLDGWGNKTTYAVPLLLTAAPINDTHGAFDVYDEHDESVLNEPQTAHIVIVSHGRDGKGAYTKQGELVENCTTSVTIDPDNPTAPPPAPVAGRDGDQSDNCDHNDEYFLGGLRTEDDDDYNDDYVRYSLYRNSELWAYTSTQTDDNGTPDDTSDDTTINRMANTNPGRIGIGTNQPDEKLHVLGDVKATRIIADSYCDSTGQDCMSAEAIAGEMPSMKCPGSQQAVVSIGDQTVNCEDVFQSEANGQCPAGTYMVGISNVQGILCEPL